MKGFGVLSTTIILVLINLILKTRDERKLINKNHNTGIIYTALQTVGILIQAAIALAALFVVFWSYKSQSTANTISTQSLLVSSWQIVGQGRKSGTNIGQIAALNVLYNVGSSLRAVDMGCYEPAKRNLANEESNLFFWQNAHRTDLKRNGYCNYISGQIWEGVDFQGSDFSGATFNAVFLNGANLSRVNFTLAHLVGVQAKNADISFAQLQYASFEHANLYGSDLRGSNLCRSFFMGANLSGATLDGSVLDHSSMGGVNFEGATMKNTHLVGTYFGSEGDAANITQAQLDMACSDPDQPPSLPKGLKAPPACPDYEAQRLLSRCR